MESGELSDDPGRVASITPRFCPHLAICPYEINTL